MHASHSPLSKQAALSALLLLIAGLAFRSWYLGELIRLDALPGTGEAEMAALSLAQSGVLGNIWTTASGPTAHVGPLYAGFLALGIEWFGWRSDGQIAWQMGSALVASVLAACLAADIVRRITGSTAWALLVLAVLSLAPQGLYDEVRAQFETCFAMLLLSAASWCCVTPQPTHRRWQGACWGVLIGVCLLLTPALIPGVLGLGAFRCVQGRPVIKSAPVLLLSWLVALILVAPWVLRNQTVMGAPIVTRSNFGLELRLGNHDEANGTSAGSHFGDRSSYFSRTHPYANPAEGRRLAAMGEVAYMQTMEAEAKSWIRLHPRRFAQLTLERARLYWLPPASFFGGDGIRSRVKALYVGGAGALALGWLAVMAWRRSSLAIVALCALLLTSTGYMVTHVNTRYRLPSLPLTVAFAAVAACMASRAAIDRLRGGRQPTTTL